MQIRMAVNQVQNQVSRDQYRAVLKSAQETTAAVETHRQAEEMRREAEDQEDEREESLAQTQSVYEIEEGTDDDEAMPEQPQKKMRARSVAASIAAASGFPPLAQAQSPYVLEPAPSVTGMSKPGSTTGPATPPLSFSPGPDFVPDWDGADASENPEDLLPVGSVLAQAQGETSYGLSDRTNLPNRSVLNFENGRFVLGSVAAAKAAIEDLCVLRLPYLVAKDAREVETMLTRDEVKAIIAQVCKSMRAEEDNKQQSEDRNAYTERL